MAVSKPFQVPLLKCSALDHMQQQKEKIQIISKLMGTNLFRRLNLKKIKVPKFTIEKFGGTVDFFQDI